MFHTSSSIFIFLVAAFIHNIHCQTVLNDYCKRTPIPGVTLVSAVACARYEDNITIQNDCKTYILCFHNGIEMVGQRYTCVGDLIFDPIFGLCVKIGSTSYTCPLGRLIPRTG